MQDEIEQRIAVQIENCAKLTGRELARALEKLLRKCGNDLRKRPIHHGKMTVKQLAEKDKGMQSIEVTDGNIGSFSRVARKYGIDFAPFKVKGEKRYTVFFKSADLDAMTAAFKEYTARELRGHGKRRSIRQKMQELGQQIQKPTREKEKNKEPER